MRDKNAEKTVEIVVDLLKKERQLQGISYRKLGEITGLHRTTISLIERRRQTPTLLVCKKICNAMNISLATIIKKAERQ